MMKRLKLTDFASQVLKTKEMESILGGDNQQSGVTCPSNCGRDPNLMTNKMLANLRANNPNPPKPIIFGPLPSDSTSTSKPSSGH